MVCSRFLSLMALSCCVCGLELNVAHSSYQAEEEQNITLDWTFTPTPDPSLKHLFIFCYMFSDDGKLSVLIDFQEGVIYSESQSEEFSGRVQFDKDLLREGRIRLHVSSLRTQDSGEYWCSVHLFAEEVSDRCRLNVTAARNQTHSKPGPEEPDSGSPGRIALYCGLGLTAAVLVVVLVLIICRRLKTHSMKSDEKDSGESLSELRRKKTSSLSHFSH